MRKRTTSFYIIFGRLTNEKKKNPLRHCVRDTHTLLKITPVATSCKDSNVFFHVTSGVAPFELAWFTGAPPANKASTTFVCPPAQAAKSGFKPLSWRDEDTVAPKWTNRRSCELTSFVG